MSSTWESIVHIAEQVQMGKCTATELVEKALQKIEENKSFNAIISLTAERAREQAQEIDERVKKGEKIGRLAGVPFIAKDNFLTFGSATTAASNILKDFDAPYQATAINRLEAEGAICVAKANMDAFGHGSSTENSDFMITKNPHDFKKVPGGSSGGSAAAVVLDMAPFSLGTDTGGSLRLPASFCGAVGFKPTYGLVSRSGVISMISSTDVIGPLTRTVEDAAVVLEVIAGKDPLDATMIDRQDVYAPINAMDLKGKKIGLISEYMQTGLDEGLRAQIESCADALRKAGAEVVAMSLPSLSLALACYYIICPAEVSSNLGRYDGQKYGFHDEQAATLEASYEYSRSKGFGREAKRRIMIGTYVLSSGYYDAYYKKAQQLRTKLIQEFEAAFKKVDFLMGPTAPVTAFEIGQNTGDPLQMYLTDIMTVAVNLVGVPAVSVPAGLVNGMPVGLQLIAPQRKDKELLMVAKLAQGVIA